MQSEKTWLQKLSEISQKVKKNYIAFLPLCEMVALNHK